MAAASPSGAMDADASSAKVNTGPRGRTVSHLTPADVAERYGVSEHFVKQRVTRKQWPHLRVGKFTRFTEAHLSEIDRMLSVPVSQEASAARSWGRKTRGGAA